MKELIQANYLLSLRLTTFLIENCYHTYEEVENSAGIEISLTTIDNIRLLYLRLVHVYGDDCTEDYHFTLEGELYMNNFQKVGKYHVYKVHGENRTPRFDKRLDELPSYCTDENLQCDVCGFRIWIINYHKPINGRESFTMVSEGKLID